MTWFICVISTKPFLEWEVEKFITTHPETSHTIIKNSFYMAFNCKPEMLYYKKPDEQQQTYNLVIGNGYIPKSTGYAMADHNDWEKLLAFEYQPKDIDGHYIALKFSEDFLQVTGDLFGSYPVFYAQTEDYFIVSNMQNYIAPLLVKKTWDYATLASLTLVNSPLEFKPLVKEILPLEAGSTLTIKKNKLIITKRELNFLSEKITDIQQYWFSLKKAFELQLEDNDFMTIPFENNHSTRLALSIWSSKPKKEWGLSCPTNTDFPPEKYLHSNITSGLKIFTTPKMKIEKEVFRLYKNYVMITGHTDFPLYFDLAGNFVPEKGINEINMLTNQSEWLFEKDPLKKSEKLYKILKAKNFANFLKLTTVDNKFFRKDFLKYLNKDLEKHFKHFTDNMLSINSLYDEYYFFLKNHQILYNAKGIAWLNDFRHFYCPGLFYSLTCKHLNQRLYNPKIAQLSSELHLSFSNECEKFPKIKEQKYTLFDYPNANAKYFPIIENQIGVMIENAQKIPYYNFPELLKIFKKAKKGNGYNIQSILKWVGFEIWREMFDS